MKNTIFLKSLVGGLALLCAGVALCACSNVKFEVSVPCQHQIELDPMVEATCTENGKTEGRHCLLCHEILVPQELIEAKGHKFKDADCENPKVCSVCGETTGLANGHDYTAATCLAPKTCRVCGKTDGAMGSHSYSEGFCVHCNERKPSEGLTYSLNDDAESYTVTGIGSCTDSIIVVPATYEGKPVTGIASLVSQNFTEIYLPKSIHLIGNRAFEGCLALERVHFSEGLIGIGTYAFNNCTALTEIALPAGTLTVGGWAFNGCVSLTIAHIPDSVTSLGKSVFAECAQLSEVELSSGLTLLDKYTFYNCVNLKTIRFSKNTADWNAIKKESGWNLSTGSYTVYCADGNVSK